MSLQAVSDSPSLREKVSDAEWQVRVDLAACYRLVDHYDMSDLTGTHISAKVPGEPGAFLLNPYGLFFDEITASSLVKLDLDGNILLDNGHEVNQAGYTIHSAVLGAREDVTCALHTHTSAGMAVSAMKCGLLPLTQHAMVFYDRLGYHDYEGVALDLDERERLVRDLGDNYAMMLRNHGLLTAGRTVPEAFWLIFYLEKCCASQVQALTSGVELELVSREVCERTSNQIYRSGNPIGHRDWPGHLRRLDKLDPGYRE